MLGGDGTLLSIPSPWINFWNIYCSFGFDIFSSFIQQCHGKLDFMKGDEPDERKLKYIKKGEKTT